MRNCIDTHTVPHNYRPVKRLASTIFVGYNSIMPRPALPKADRRDQLLPVRFSANELQRVRKAAKRDKQPVSSWIRSLIEQAMKREKGKR